eukprot:TRINITY_DN10631_c0_g3_i1.p1 TRINITY_DN10631_c0_g3~~TRINITY_DN10631_c0_g3_i1.p1  ORF type:complete len:354 (+),score=74.79 TRINITY_DN10631_c0_g3_i1:73-1134(+)
MAAQPWFRGNPDLAGHGANWLLLSDSAPSSRGLAARSARSTPRAAGRPRRSGLGSSFAAQLRRGVGDAAGAGVSTRHPDEWAQRRKLLLDPDDPVALVSRPREGRRWVAAGQSLALRAESGAAISQRDVKEVAVNDFHECQTLTSVFPDFYAVGSRCLQPGALNRIAVELRRDAGVRATVLQVGVARIAEGDSIFEGLVDSSWKLHGALFCTNTGDVFWRDGDDPAAAAATSGGGPPCADRDRPALSVLAPGGVWPGLRPREADWCQGAPQWLGLQGEARAVVLLEVDLQRGRLAISVDEWSEDPVVLDVPGLLPPPGPPAEDSPIVRWRPFVSLTGPGTQARLLDLHTRMDM